MAGSTAATAPHQAPHLAHQPPSAETVDLLLRLLPQLRELMDTDELMLYVDGCEQVHHGPGRLLYGEGEPIDSILLLVDGNVREARTHTVAGVQAQYTVRDAGSGALLGAFDLVHRRRHTTAAKTLGACNFVSIPAAQISRLLYHHPKVRGSLLPVELTNRLRSIPMLAGVDGVSLSYLASIMHQHNAVAGEVLYQAGTEVPFLYLISRGQVLLEQHRGGRLWLGTGAEFGFGDEADAPADKPYPLDHNATAVCATTLLRVRRDQFFAITGLHVERRGMELRNLRNSVVQQTGLFAQYSSQARSHLLGFMSHYTLPSSFLVAQQGEEADSLWLLLPGSGALIHSLGADGQARPETRIAGATWFGEQALRERGLAASTVEAEPGSNWLRLHWRDFGAFLDQTGQPQMGDQLRMNYRPPPPVETQRKRLFPWLEMGETVALEARRHWFDLVLKCLPAVVLTLLALFAARSLPVARNAYLAAANPVATPVTTPVAASGATPIAAPTATPTATPTPTVDELQAAAAGATAGSGITQSADGDDAAVLMVTPVATADPQAAAQPSARGARVWLRFLNWILALSVVGAALAWFWGINDYLNDYLVVTNQRVVHQEKVVFFKHNRFMAPLEQIKDVKINRGFWGARFGYATLDVQTPGTAGNIIFERAERYQEVEKSIRIERARRAALYRTSGKKQIHTALEHRLGVALVLPDRVWPQGVEATPLAKATQSARRRRLRTAIAASSSMTARKVWRQHWIILLRNILWQTLLMLTLMGSALAVQIMRLGNTGDGSAGVAGRALVLTLMLAGIVTLLWLLWILRDWQLDQYVLDKDQVIDIMRRPLGFQLDQRSAQLSDLVDIRFEQPTPFHILFNFGSVFLQTAASEGQFTFLNVPDPQTVTEEIRRRRDHYQQEVERRKALQRAEEFPDWLEIYTRLQPGRMD